MSDVSALAPNIRSPIVAAIAVVKHQGRVLLVRRRNNPDAGLWGFPGGKIEFGEAIDDAAVRELFEETGITGRPEGVLTAVDAFDVSDSGELTQHFVLVAVSCEWISGEPMAGDDAMEAAWFTEEDLQKGALATSIDVAEIARAELQARRR